MGFGEMKQEHTLKVVGHGKVMLMPDEVEIVFFLQQTDKSFAKAQQDVKARFSQLEQMVLDFGLPADGAADAGVRDGQSDGAWFFPS